MSDNDVIDTIELDGFTVKIYQDSDPMNPREWDNLGNMVCFHSGYNLGDCKQNDKEQFDSPDDFREWIKDNHTAIILPLFVYEHSGITISTGSFHDLFDSGQVGWIYVTYEDIRDVYGWKYITGKRAKQIMEYLKNEVTVYDQYLTGDVYGYIVECNECHEEIDSCWGYYGNNWKTNGIMDDKDNLTCDTCNAKKQEEEEIENRLAMIV